MAIYYVSKAGGASDSNPGSEAEPWLTIGHAAGVVAAGDTVYVVSGTYDEHSITISASGTATNRIRFISQTAWGAQILPQADVTESQFGIPGNHIFYLSGDYIDVVGFHIAPGAAGIIQNGIGIVGDNCTARRCRIRDINIVSTWAGTPIWSTGYGSVIDGNVILNTGASTTISAIYIVGGTATVVNNVVVDVYGNGIQTWHAVYTAVICNNTVCDCTADGFWIAASDSVTLTDGKICNNISYSNSGYGIYEASGTSGCTYANNLLYGNGTGISLTNGTETGTVTSAPVFVDYQADGSGDYHPDTGSASINAGASAYAPVYDADGYSRVSTADIGAYDYTASSPWSGPLFTIEQAASALKVNWLDATSAFAVEDAPHILGLFRGAYNAAAEEQLITASADGAVKLADRTTTLSADGAISLADRTVAATADVVSLDTRVVTADADTVVGRALSETTVAVSADVAALLARTVATDADSTTLLANITVATSVDGAVQIAQSPVTATADGIAQSAGQTVVSSADIAALTTRVVAADADSAVGRSVAETSVSGSADVAVVLLARTLAADADVAAGRATSQTSAAGNADAVVLLARTASADADLAALTSASLSASADGYVIEAGVFSIVGEADGAVLLRDLVSTASANGAVQTTPAAVVASGDAALLVSRAVEPLADGALSAVRTLSADADSAVAKAFAAQASADGVSQTLQTSSISADAAVQSAVTLFASADGYVIEAGVFTVVALGDSAVQAGRTGATDLDAASSVSVSLAASGDAALQTARTATTSADAAATIVRTLSASADANAQITSVIAADADASVRKALFVSANADTVIQLEGVFAAADAAVQTERTAQVSADVNVGTGYSASLDIDAVVERTLALTASADGAAIVESLSIGLAASVGVAAINAVAADADSAAIATLANALALNVGVQESDRSLTAEIDALVFNYNPFLLPPRADYMVIPRIYSHIVQIPM